MSHSDVHAPIATRETVKAIAAGAAIAIAGIVPWIVMAQLNAEVRPDLPWAALATVVYLLLLLAWLNGAGPPRRWKRHRRRLLRLRSGSRAEQVEGDAMRAPTIVIALVLLTVAWITLSSPARSPDLSDYPTTAYRFSVAIMGAAVSGIVEEAAFRGYMQRGLERFGVHRAILITSVVFVLAHGVHGLGTLVVTAPGFFLASWLYGWLAWRTGSVVPGMVIHSLGDLAYTYFVLLGGDHRLLFAP